MDQLEEDSSFTGLRAPFHALLLPYPAQGHVNPIMQLGKRLAAVQGVRVTVAIIEHMHAKILRAQQLALGSYQLSDNFQLLGIKDGLPEDFDRENWNADLQNVVDKTLAVGALELLHSLSSQGRPVTCIVGDFFLRWTCSLAKKASVPEFIFWPQCLSSFSMYLHVDAIISSGYDPYDGNVRATASRETPMDLINCIPGLPMSIHPGDLPFECPFGKNALEWMRDVLRDRFNCMREAHGVIANSFEELEPEVFNALTRKFLQEGTPHAQHKNCWPSRPIKLVGPLVPRAIVSKSEGYGDVVSGGSLWKEEVEDCRQWLDSQPAASVLFVAFGSIMSISVTQVKELALGLAASGQKILWVIREKAISNKVVEFLPNSGPTEAETVTLEEALPHGFLELNQHNCKVVRWAPQAMVLSHPSVGGFFSHCGWNSTLESLCCGVPLLGWPWLMDQATNCWLASHVWKVGLTLERDEDNLASKEKVERGVRQLMEGPLTTSLRARAGEIRDLARTAAQRSDGVLSLVEDIREISASQHFKQF